MPPQTLHSKRNAGYHGPADTYDKLDYRRMAKVIQGVYSFIAQR